MLNVTTNIAFVTPNWFINADGVDMGVPVGVIEGVTVLAGVINDAVGEMVPVGVIDAVVVVVGVPVVAVADGVCVEELVDELVLVDVPVFEDVPDGL